MQFILTTTRKPGVGADANCAGIPAIMSSFLSVAAKKDPGNEIPDQEGEAL